MKNLGHVSPRHNFDWLSNFNYSRSHRQHLFVAVFDLNKQRDIIFKIYPSLFVSVKTFQIRGFEYFKSFIGYMPIKAAPVLYNPQVAMPNTMRRGVGRGEAEAGWGTEMRSCESDRHG